MSSVNPNQSKPLGESNQINGVPHTTKHTHNQTVAATQRVAAPSLFGFAECQTEIPLEVRVNVVASPEADHSAKLMDEARQCFFKELDVPQSVTKENINVQAYAYNRAGGDDYYTAGSPVKAPKESDTSEVDSEESVPFDTKFLSMHEFSSITREKESVLHGEPGLVYDLFMQKVREVGGKRQKADDTTLVSGSSKDINFYLNGKGKVYLQAAVIGKGGFKVAYKVFKVGDEKFDKLAKAKALSMPKDLKKVTSPIDMHILAKEKEILQHLRDQKKTGAANLSRVDIPKPVDILKDGVTATGYLSPYASGGSLNHVLRAPLDEEDKSKLVQGTIEALSQLHAAGVIHGDVKPDNFLLFRSDDGEIELVKITDYGSSSLASKGETTKGRMLPWTHSAPEWMKAPYPVMKAEGDIYQLGITIYQILTQTSMDKLCFGEDVINEFAIPQNLRFADKIDHLPDNLKVKIQETVSALMKADKHFKAKASIALREDPGIWPGMEELPENVRKFIARMVNKDPAARPTLDEVKAFFEKI